MRCMHLGQVYPADGIDAGHNVEQVGEECEKEECADQGEKPSRLFSPYHSHNQVEDAFDAPFNEILYAGGDEFPLARAKEDDNNHQEDSYPGAEQGVGDWKSKRPEYHIRWDIKALKLPEHAVPP